MIWVRTLVMMAAGVLVAQCTPRHDPASGREIADARQAVQQATAALGEDHPVTAMMLRNLALAFEQGGYPNYAEHYAQRSIAILTARFGPGDVSLVPALNVLAEACVSQARYGEAREVAARAVDIGPGAGLHYATALHNLGAALQGEGQLRQAIESYQRALAEREALLPAGHPYIKVTRAALDQVQHAAKAAARRTKAAAPGAALIPASH